MEGVLSSQLVICAVPGAHITELSPALEQCQETGDAVDLTMKDGVWEATV